MKDSSRLTVRGLKVHYTSRASGWGFKTHVVKAVDGVSFTLEPGKTLGLVGESGCGKSSLGRAVLQLIPPTAGSVQIEGTELVGLKAEPLRRARRDLQMVFQDPYASLNPRMTIQQTLAEPLLAHERLSRKELELRIEEILDWVGMPAAARKRYPHEFSGGQRQRIAIARALILKPKVLIADEPVSSLDVSVQAQILNLLKELQRRLGLSLLFISHNLAVVKYIAQDVCVMYLGKIVEAAPAEKLYRDPQHPYTKALLSAVPIPDPKIERTRKRIELHGELPSPAAPPAGCTFHTRCPIAVEKCRVEVPELLAMGDGLHAVRCPVVNPNVKQKAASEAATIQQK